LARRARASAENSKLKTSNSASYSDASGFSKSANLPEIISHGHVLTPGRYVGAEDLKKLWTAADKLRSNLDAAVYKHAVLGQFSLAEGKKGGQYFTPKSIVSLIVNIAIRGIDFDFGKEPADTFTRGQHPDLAPNGSMALLLANGSMSSNSSGEGDIRRALIEADLVECMVALPGQLFTNTQIPACIGFLTKNKAKRSRPGAAALRDRHEPQTWASNCFYAS
jgi:hypothetical protein